MVGKKQPDPKDDAAAWIKKAYRDLKESSATKQIVVGGVGGWVSGYVAAKFGKTAATAAGGTILMLHVSGVAYGWLLGAAC